jgi:opacity protein-like surface antigen
MYRKHTVFSISGAIIVLVLTVPASNALAALDRDGFWLSLGPRATYFVEKDNDFDNGKFFGGAQLRLHFGQTFAIEGSVDYRREKFDSSRADVYPVQVSGLVYLIRNFPISPYLLAGGGWYYTHVKGPGAFDDTQHRFGAHTGGGVELFLSRVWSLDAGYRYIWLETLDSKDQNLLNNNFDDSGHQLTGALNFHF